LKEEHREMAFPEELKYSKTHEWIKFNDDETATVGITDFAQHELGELVFVDLPAEGDSMSIGESFAEVESVKAVSEVNGPVDAEVEAVNADLQDNPQLINEQPYDAWFVKVKNITAKDELMDAAQYEEFTKKEG
jgi:glycine cleavage system H protein